jgi:hypothetical protein
LVTERWPQKQILDEGIRALDAGTSPAYSRCLESERLLTSRKEGVSLADGGRTASGVAPGMCQEKPTFQADIRPLFRESDIEAMRDALDLASLDDVRLHAETIHRRLEEGSMPCDQMWPMSDVELFRTWIDTGMLP